MSYAYGEGDMTIRTVMSVFNAEEHALMSCQNAIIEDVNPKYLETAIRDKGLIPEHILKALLPPKESCGDYEVVRRCANELVHAVHAVIEADESGTKIGDFIDCLTDNDGYPWIAMTLKRELTKARDVLKSIMSSRADRRSSVVSSISIISNAEETTSNITSSDENLMQWEVARDTESL
ncbi:hypothetical protein HDE_14143 [Halotydeus destructor]|nr:hypothetical protein HDE_14143 [Halotydeus destructor]